MEYTIVGKIINSHGIKGEVKIYPLTDNINRFDYLKTAYIGDKKIKVELERVKYHKNLAILKFKEFNDINEIIFLKDSFIYVDETEKVVLPENHFFIYDLVGSKVFDTKNNLIGILSDVIQGPSNDVYIIKDVEKDKEYLIPAVNQFIININIDNKEIVVNPIEGMIE
ncbi:ribosome maturation factor RimM [Tissierella pigra]|uniref:Ribosome maturation factor RimM n=1 Tax=Tissierella pigra TaxID=2607614 RepID=A0A6N7XRK6_9FIRM|nr:ribosome maturation factor RimM [Tissierella pigra]MBU5426511.1 ribosome maturation factor RimM [Tissierella pigra]MSU00043.1 16S rRNA processing protein RimM [Tissierella pigra]